LLEVDLDWEFLFQQGCQHGVMPLLYWHLNKMSPGLVPQAVLEQLRAFFRQTGIRNLSLTNELVRLVELFTRHGIDVLPFKGPALALSLYGNLGLRSIRDLDVLVKKGDVVAAKQLLVGEGYQPVFETDYHCRLSRQEGDICIEIHWEILPGYLRRRLNMNSVWNHVTQTRIAAQPTGALSREELFVVLCVHAQKHGWLKLKWIGDIGWMIQSQRRIDWPGVMWRTAEMEQGRAVLEGCFLAASFLQVQLPGRIRRILESDRSLRARAALIRGRLFRPGNGLPGFREWLAYLEAGNESFRTIVRDSLFRRRLQYLMAVMTPDTVDRCQLQLPVWLSFVHYIYRPMRLFGRHGTGLFERLA
jgi:hypothetical protein